jgi:uncharacterized protein YwlG (UPF0340 family)
MGAIPPYGSGKVQVRFHPKRMAGGKDTTAALEEMSQEMIFTQVKCALLRVTHNMHIDIDIDIGMHMYIYGVSILIVAGV